MLERVKKVTGWLLLAFLVYAIVKSPTQAADIVRTSLDVVVQGVRSIGAFFDALMK
ncbi:MAG: hypothetical protein M3Y71_13550 [Actinomycetota bacterium]|nr:hypothetical protein [Actinomycetota bacterium]